MGNFGEQEKTAQFLTPISILYNSPAYILNIKACQVHEDHHPKV